MLDFLEHCFNEKQCLISMNIALMKNNVLIYLNIALMKNNVLISLNIVTVPIKDPWMSNKQNKTELGGLLTYGGRPTSQI